MLKSFFKNKIALNNKSKSSGDKACLETVKKLIINDPRLLTVIVGQNKEDIDGVKTLILSFPDLFKILSLKDSRALKKIYAIGEIMNNKQFTVFQNVAFFKT